MTKPRDAERQLEEAIERAKIAEGRSAAAEERARSAGEAAAAAGLRIDELEAKLQDVVSDGLQAQEGSELVELQRQLAAAREHTVELQDRVLQAEGRLEIAGSLDEPAEELLRALEKRVLAAEAQATGAQDRIRAFEDQVADSGSRFRRRLGLSVGRKLGGPPPAQEEQEPEQDLRAAIARSLRGPLTRATGLTLSLQGSTPSTEGKAALRELSSSLRRLDQLAADLRDVHRLIDGSLPLKRRRTDMAALLKVTLDDATHLEDRFVRLDDDAVSARVDPMRARQIIEAMLEAARDRTRAGAAIVVRLRETDIGARVSVEDDSRQPAAIGPEMRLAVRLAELHGTEITVDGSSYCVVFPKVEG